MSFVKMMDSDLLDSRMGTVVIPAVPETPYARGGVSKRDKDAQEEAAKRAREHSPDAEKEVHETLASGELIAKYKIEVTFTQGRTTHGPNVVGIQVWESGKRFNGGGDELAFFCKDASKGSDLGCWGVIIGDYVKGGIAYCPHCKRQVNASLLTNMKVGRVTSQNLAKELAKLFRELGSNADIYLKYHMTDVRYIAMERAKGPDVAARLKGMHLYPLKNIVKDTSAGADLAKRFFIFITS